MKSFERNENLEITYHSCETTFDTQKLNGKCDVILLPNNRSDGAPDKLENIKKVGIFINPKLNGKFACIKDPDIKNPIAPNNAIIKPIAAALPIALFIG